MLEITETGVYASLATVVAEGRRLAQRWVGKGITDVCGIPRGGLYPALIVAETLGVPVTDQVTANTLVVDDLVDSGRTAEWWVKSHHFDALYRKSHSPAHIAPEATEIEGWITFAWETNETGPEDAVVRLLEYVGEDPTRDGLIDTPKRVIKALTELTTGYGQSPETILSTTFDVGSDEMIVVSNIEFSSMCEHHMLPFIGHVTIGYIPRGRVVGLSKLARLVDVFAKRLQVQERLTREIAQAIEDHLDTVGVGVIVTSHHSCMGLRGVKKPSAKMTTSSLLGVFRSDPVVRSEFLAHHDH